MTALDQQVAGKDQLLARGQRRQDSRVISNTQGLGMGQGATAT
jgi:hypothetical protein